MDVKTTMSGPVDLPPPMFEPAPVAGCDVCAVLKRDRETARSKGDLSKVTDCNVEMRSHHLADGR
ncbi:hypothetical protein ACIRU8_03010 [Streptomyces sp. NPDC101175]|uniref:hypothetical protein n=1 Tax=Streptomyces sp. NPDC101175 TaxID=3366123 RepID=UPI003838AC4C